MASTTPQKDFNVAIVGGGVCGLTGPIALSQSGIRVDIFEAAVGSFSPPSRFYFSTLITKYSQNSEKLERVSDLVKDSTSSPPSPLDNNKHLDRRTEFASYFERNRSLRRCLREIWCKHPQHVCVPIYLGHGRTRGPF